MQAMANKVPFQNPGIRGVGQGFPIPLYCTSNGAVIPAARFHGPEPVRAHGESGQWESGQCVGEGFSKEQRHWERYTRFEYWYLLSKLCDLGQIHQLL